MTKHVTIPDLWDAFLEADDNLKLKVGSIDSANRIKSALSTYKTRLLQNDPGLAEDIGKFQFDFTISKNGSLVILEIGMKRTKARAILDVEIIEEREQADG